MKPAITMWEVARLTVPGNRNVARGTASDMRELHRIVPLRNDQLDELILKVGPGSTRPIWRDAVAQLGQQHGRVRALAAKAALEVAFAGTALLNVTMKLAVRRPRPFNYDTSLEVVGRRPEMFAFPSGHAAAAAAGASVVSRFFPQHRATAWKAADTMGLTRMYKGVHYPSDVRAGRRLGRVVGGTVASPVTWVAGTAGAAAGAHAVADRRGE